MTSKLRYQIIFQDTFKSNKSILEVSQIITCGLRSASSNSAMAKSAKSVKPFLSPKIPFFNAFSVL